MKQNNRFILKEIAGVPYLLPFGQMIADQRRGLKTNATGVFVWNLLKEDLSLEKVLSHSAAYYEISPDEKEEFETDITLFVKQLLSLGILVETETAPSAQVVYDEVQRSRHNALALAVASPYILTENTASILLSIGNLLLNYTGPTSAFPPGFTDFICPDQSTDFSPIHQNIYLHTSIPSDTVSGQIVLQNPELNIIEQDTCYLLHFPTTKHHLEFQLSKDGTAVHCYSLPPYNNDFYYDFFHAVRLAYLFRAQKADMVALHSASILYKNKLWLFSGHSGMGKTTHTNLWKEYFHTPVINGDLNLLAMENGLPVVHGIPWCGTSGIYDIRTYPLGGIILLSRGSTNYIEELSTDQKQLLVSQRLISPTWTEDLWENNLELTKKITQNILVCKLYCTKEKKAAEVMKKHIDQYIEY